MFAKCSVSLKKEGKSKGQVSFLFFFFYEAGFYSVILADLAV